MKRSTALKRLGDVLDAVDESVRWPGTSLAVVYVFGDLLGGAGELDRFDLALVVDEDPDSVPWMARPAHLEALASMLRLPKLPVSWCWRPVGWPVWNHSIMEAVRVWSRDEGRDATGLDALSAGRVAVSVVDAPADEAARGAQVRVECAVARRHLASVTASFYESGWRRSHRGAGVHPEDHLWWATAGYLDLDDAAQAIGP